LIGRHATLGQEAVSESAAAKATAASRRLDSAFRSYLAEQGTKLVHREELASLVGGASRLMLAASSLATLPIRTTSASLNDERLLDAELHTLSMSLEQIADDLAPARNGSVSAPTPEPVGVRLMTPESVCARWIHHHLSHLEETVGPLSAAAIVVRDARGPLAR
jgi:hypothetical protein